MVNIDSATPTMMAANFTQETRWCLLSPDSNKMVVAMCKNEPITTASKMEKVL